MKDYRHSFLEPLGHKSERERISGLIKMVTSYGVSIGIGVKSIGIRI